MLSTFLQFKLIPSTYGESTIWSLTTHIVFPWGIHSRLQGVTFYLCLKTTAVHKIIVVHFRTNSQSVSSSFAFFSFRSPCFHVSSLSWKTTPSIHSSFIPRSLQLCHKYRVAGAQFLLPFTCLLHVSVWDGEKFASWKWHFLRGIRVYASGRCAVQRSPPDHWNSGIRICSWRATRCQNQRQIFKEFIWNKE